MMIQKRLLFLALASLCAVAGQAAFGQNAPPSAPLTLESALQIATSHRASLVSAQKAYQAALALRSALAAYPATTITLGDSTRPDLQQGEDLLVTQPVDLFGKFRSGRKVGDAGVSKAFADLTGAKISTQTEVIKAFAQAAAAQLLVQLGEKQLQIAQSLFDGATKRVGARDLPPIQAVRAQLGLDSAKAALDLRKSQATAAFQQLSGAIGAQVSSLQPLAMPSLPPPQPHFSNRSDLLLAHSAVLAAQAAHMVDRLSSLPDFEIQARRAFWSLPQQYGLQFQMTWKFWDHGASRNQVKSDSFSILAAEASYEDAFAKAQAEVLSAQSLYQGATAAVGQYQKLETTASALLTQTQKAFELGGATLLDVLDAEQAFTQVEENDISASLSAAQAAADYYQATGDLITNP